MTNFLKQTEEGALWARRRTCAALPCLTKCWLTFAWSLSDDAIALAWSPWKVLHSVGACDGYRVHTAEPSWSVSCLNPEKFRKENHRKTCWLVVSVCLIQTGFTLLRLKESPPLLPVPETITDFPEDFIIKMMKIVHYVVYNMCHQQMHHKAKAWLLCNHKSLAFWNWTSDAQMLFKVCFGLHRFRVALTAPLIANVTLLPPFGRDVKWSKQAELQTEKCVSKTLTLLSFYCSS